MTAVNQAVMNWQYEDSAVDQLVTALVMGPYQAVVGLVWLLGCIARGTAFCVRENAALVARYALIVGVVLLSVMVWQLAVGGVLIAAYGWMMWR